MGPVTVVDIRVGVSSTVYALQLLTRDIKLFFDRNYTRRHLSDLPVLIQSDFDEYDTTSYRSRQRQDPYVRMAGPAHNSSSTCSPLCAALLGSRITDIWRTARPGLFRGLVSCGVTICPGAMHAEVQVWLLSISLKALMDFSFLSMERALVHSDSMDPQPLRGVSVSVEACASSYEACAPCYANIFDTKERGNFPVQSIYKPACLC